MIDIPDPPRAGEPIKAALLKRILDILRSLRITPGPGLYARTTPVGTSIGLTSGTSGSAGSRLVPADVCPAVIRSGTSIAGVYSVLLYPYGIGGPVRNAATVCLTERGVENDLPAGTIVLAHAIVIAAAEDGDDGE